MVDLKEFMTTDKAAEQLGLDVQTVRRLFRQGTLQGEKIGRVTLVLISSVTAYKEKNANKGKNDPTRSK
jgi:excisionase family DNA binding protein